MVEDTNSETALLSAAKFSHLGAVEEPLSHSKTNPNVQFTIAGNPGETFLGHAVDEQIYTFTKLLLKHPNIDPNMEDDGGRTPLNYAFRNKDLVSIELLLEHPGINPDKDEFHLSFIDSAPEETRTRISARIEEICKTREPAAKKQNKITVYLARLITPI